MHFKQEEACGMQHQCVNNFPLYSMAKRKPDSNTDPWFKILVAEWHLTYCYET